MKLDPVGVAPYRLYRESTRYVDGKVVKVHKIKLYLYEIIFLFHVNL